MNYSIQYICHIIIAEVSLVARFYISNDGIGSYEFHGQQCHDIGEDFPSDITIFNPEMSSDELDEFWEDNTLAIEESVHECFYTNCFSPNKN